MTGILSLVMFCSLVLTDIQGLRAQCILDGNWSITQPSCPFSSNGKICCDTLYGITPGTGIGPYTCSISTNDEVPANNCFENLPVGTYTITTTSADGCIGIFHNLELTSPYDPIEISATEIPATCGSANGTVCCSVSGGSGSFSYQWIASNFEILGTDLCLTNLDPNESYTFAAYDENSPCFAGAGISVSESIFDITLNTTASNCINPTCNGTATLTPNGTAPYNVAWEEGGLIDSTYTDSIQLTELCPGNYSANVTDVNGCSTFIEFTIEANTQLIEAFFEENEPTCEVHNGEICLTVSNDNTAYQLEWMNLTTNTILGTNPCINEIEAGLYQATLVDPTSSCQWTFYHELNSIPLVIETEVYSSTCLDPYCNGSVTMNLPSAMPYDLEWTNNELPNQLIESNQISLTELCPGQYSGIISANDNCEVNIEFTIGLDEPNENETPCLTIDVNENSILDVQIWPNPFTQILQVILPEEAAFIEWLDLTGRIIHTEQALYPKQIFNLSKLADGNYMMRVVMQDGISIVKRVLKQ